MPLGGVFAKFCASGKGRVSIAFRKLRITKRKDKGSKKEKESVFLGVVRGIFSSNLNIWQEQLTSTRINNKAHDEALGHYIPRVLEPSAFLYVLVH